MMRQPTQQPNYGMAPVQYMNSNIPVQGGNIGGASVVQRQPQQRVTEEVKEDPIREFRTKLM